MPQGQLDRPARQGQPRPVAAEHLQARVPRIGRGGGRSGGPPAAARGAASASSASTAADRGPDQGQHVRAGDVVAAGHVDRAQQRAGDRVVHRCRRAAPRLHRPPVVLAAVELDGVVDGQGRARGVRAGDVLGPPGALDEVHPGGAGPQPRIPFDPQHPAAGVGDRDDHPVGLGVLDEQPADDRHDRGQRVRLAVGEAGRRPAGRPGGVPSSGSTPLLSERRQESRTTDRTDVVAGSVRCR